MANNKGDARTYSHALDHQMQMSIARMTHGFSPASLMLAFADWYLHLSIHPAKQTELATRYKETYIRITELLHNKNFSPDLNDKKIDKRFRNEAWQQYPFSSIYHSFLSIQELWQTATTNIPGVSKHHEDVVNFTVRQFLDMYSPSNFPFLNPEVIQATIAQNGQNYVRGLNNFLEDFKRYADHAPPAGAENYIVGKDVAATPGKVIYRNPLMELIQYAPQTEKVFAEPVLITPAWIMKYYILDLKPDDSLVRYLVNKGHTVFMISWKNPDESYRDTSMQDYLDLGIRSAVHEISTVIPKQKIHLVGYCLGGTLAAIAAAAFARDKKDILKSMTIFAAQTDFTEPGELGLFIDESQISFLESMMRQQGYLDTHQMAGAFQLLRSNDLIWSRMIHDYMLGERAPLSDVMAWNADATRLPYQMHHEYLCNLFLNNQLAEGKYLVDGKTVALTDIRKPIFVVATERDHVSPWKSVFKINLLTTANVTFTLTSGGHNVGIVSKPANESKLHYRISTLKESSRYIDPESWFEKTNKSGGSWWPAWTNWLAKHSGQKVAPPKLKKSLDDAPGQYVLEK